MVYYIFLIIFINLIILLGNYTFYIFNLTNFLLYKDIMISDNSFFNFLFITMYISIFLILMTIILNHLKIKRNLVVHLFIIALINTIILSFCLIWILNITKMKEINNVLCLLVITFFSTYVFFYSIYYHSLLEYKRNH